jgi:4'-phosphopantetheinyl transferase
VISSVEPTMAFPSVAELTNGRTSPVTVGIGMVDVWSGSLEGSEAVRQRYESWLSEEERARASRFVRAEDRTRFTLAHGGLRVILAWYIGVEPAELRFRVGSIGKPALLEPQSGPHGLHFNLSHSHGRLLIAVAKGREVGIDLEQVRDNRKPLKLAERFYTPAESRWIKSRPASDHALQFYRLWVAKEAVLKAQGCGIASLQQCEILASSSASRASVRGISETQQGWSIQWLNCGSGWQGAVSAYGDDWSVRVLDAVSV